MTTAPTATQRDGSTQATNFEQIGNSHIYFEGENGSDRVPLEAPTSFFVQYFSTYLSFVHSAYASSVEQTVKNRLEQSVYITDFGAVADFNYSSPNPTTATNNIDALRKAVATGRSVIIPSPRKGFGWRFADDGNGSIDVVKAGQTIVWESAGGYGYGDNDRAMPLFDFNNLFITTGTWAEEIRTRRKFRANSGSDQDDAISVLFNIQAEGVHLIRPAFWNYVDYSDTSPTNLGGACDTPLFIGTRPGTYIYCPLMIGYYRSAGIYEDITNGRGFPRFNDNSGTAYPTATVENGADGTFIFNPYIRGPRRAIVRLGALPKSGATDYGDQYYDAIAGQLLDDTRGSFGASDFLCLQGRLYGPEHHSGRRLLDPTLDGGALTLTSLLAEPEDAPCVVQIDGLAGNAENALWNMSFLCTRIATIEALSVRLDRASRIRFTACHMEKRNGQGTDTAGNAINTNDFTTISYGHITGTTNTSRVSVNSSNAQNIDDFFPHYYGTEFSLVTDSGRYFIDKDSYIACNNGALDLRCLTADDDGSILKVRIGNETKIRAEENELHIQNSSNSISLRNNAGSGDADLRAADTRDIILRSGSVTTGRVGPSASSFEAPLNLGEFTLATLPDAASFPNHIITVTDAPHGATIAKSNGTDWLNLDSMLPVATAVYGSFTPTFQFVDLSLTTFSEQVGWYYRTRDIWHVSVKMTYAMLDITDASNVTIAGFPFNNENDSIIGQIAPTGMSAFPSPELIRPVDYEATNTSVGRIQLYDFASGTDDYVEYRDCNAAGSIHLYAVGRIAT
jgi:hypothetical protein